MSAPSTRVSEPAAGPIRAHRWRRVAAGDLLAVAVLIIEAGLIEFSLRRLLTRPFYYDEASRAYEIALGRGFLANLHIAAAPLAFGWFAIETASRVLLGDTEAGLRAPMFLALPVLGAATYWLARRWLGIWPSFIVAGLLLVNGWIVNYALQLKSYSYEGLVAVATVALYLVIQRTTGRPLQLILWYVALGFTCVFSLPNVFVVGPLLVLDLIGVVRDRHQAALRVSGAALAAAIALVHYAAFVSPQSGVAGTQFFTVNFAPHQLGAFGRFVAAGFASYVPSMVVGIEGGAANAAPVYPLPASARDLLAVVIVLLLAAGVAAAVRNAAGRALVTAIGGALLCELFGSVVKLWPFGLLRVNIFVLPLLYVLAGLGAVSVAAMLRGSVHAFWRRSVTFVQAITLVIMVAVVTVSSVVTVVATAGSLAGTARLAAEPTWWGATRAAVARARQAGGPADVVIIRADRVPPDWYAGPWLYYMDRYQGYPPQLASRAAIPAGNTTAVDEVTPRSIATFLAAHPRAPTVFLLEYRLPGNIFPAWAHHQSVLALAHYGYCSEVEIPLSYTGALTIFSRHGCARA